MSKNPTIGVLAIQGDVREHINALTHAGVTAVPVKRPEHLHHIAGLVIPGGESTTMSILAVKNHLFEPLRALQAGGLPMYGSCAGLIMLADHIADGRSDQQTVGGLDIVARRNAFGRQVDSFEIDLRIPAVGDSDFHAIFIRAPLVESVGPSVEVLASIPKTVTHDESERIVAVRQGNLLATSFHPEITTDLRIHELFIEMVRSA
ncbi:MAG: pyridoxal 5'-phosphate synthase glutaminase subunit PdxT [Actinomycetes bacterium]